MATYTLNALGLKCPQPVLKVAVKAKELQPGDILEVLADCPSFPKDIEAWCKRMGKTLLVCSDEGNGKVKAQIQF
ncbi:MAG: SirA-like protein [Candidatus Cloacimonas sp. 4484_209]|nr:MAG: SirA-like protein [Candidatus Cloacimonas sp. 4484_209]